MTNETILKYKGKGFWIEQRFVEVLSDFICKAFESSGINSFPLNIRDIYDDCDSNRKGYSPGMVTILFDSSIITVSDKTLMISVIDTAANMIDSFNPILGVSYLNNLESLKPDSELRREWRTPIKTQSLIITLDIIKDVINESYEYSFGSVYYKGFSNPAGVNEI